MTAGIEQRQQLRAAVAAAHRDQRRDRRIVPRIVERRGTHGGLPCNVSPARKNALVVDRFEAETSELGDAGVELLPLERAGRARRSAMRSPGAADAAAFESQRSPIASRAPRHRKAAISAAIA